MFRCENCRKVVGPKIGSTKVIMVEEPISYTYTDLEGEVKVSSGTKIVSEISVCPACLNNPVRIQAPADFTKLRAMARGMQLHARGCKKDPKECMICRENIRAFESYPAPALAASLQDIKSIPGSFSFARVAVENLLARAHHATLQKSKRAQADFDAAYPILKGYEGRGGSL